MTSFNSKRITFFLGLFLLLSSTNASGDSEIAATFTAFADISVIPAGESDSDFAIPPESPLSFSLAFSPETIGPGSVSTLTYTITNETDSLIENLEFSNTLPVGMTIASPVNASSTCGQLGVLTASEGSSLIMFKDGGIGSSSVCQISVNVTSSTEGTETNTSGDLMSDAGNSGTASADFSVELTLPGFSKSFSPSSIPLGGKSTLTFTIDNTLNDYKLGNLDFTDNLPIGMVIANPANASTDCTSTVASTTITAIAGSNYITLDANGTTLGSGNEVLSLGDSCTVTVDVEAIGAGMLNNITGDLLVNNGGGAGKASATLEVTVSPISIEKSFLDDPTPPGDSVLLEFKLLNFDRIFEATGVAFTDSLTKLSPLLPGLLFSSVASNDCGGSISGMGTQFMELSGGTIASEGSCTCKVWLSIPASATPGAYTNTTGTVTGTVDGSPVVGNMASDDLYVEPIPILTMEFLEVGTLAPDPVVNPGDSVVVRYTISNTSITSGATDIAFLDELTNGGIGTGFLPSPLNVSLPPIPNPPCGVGSSLALVALVLLGEDRWALGLTGGKLTAAPGASSSCTFEVTILVPAEMPAGNYTSTTEEITATVDGATRTGKPATDDLSIIAAPQLSMAFTDDQVAPGGTVTLEFTLSNSANNPGDATAISLTNDLAAALAGLTANLPTSPDPPCGAGSTLTGSLGDSFLTLAGGSLAPGDDCTFSITLNVPVGASPGSYTNTTSEVSATVGGTSTNSPAASDDLDISGLKFSKEFLNNPVIAGDTSTLRFTIENVHPSENAEILSFSDNLADVITDLAATGGAPSMNTCGGSLSGTTILSYSGGSVAFGDSCVIEVDVIVPPGTADGSYANATSLLSTDQGSIDPATDVLEVQSSLIGLKKEFTQDFIAPGDTAILKFTLTNLDPLRPIDSLGFTDDLDAMLSGATFEGGVSNTCGGMVSGNGTIKYDYPGISIAAGDSCEIHIKVAIPSATAQGIYTNTTSEVKGTIAGLAVNGPAASDDIEVVQLLDFTKSFDGPSTATGRPKLTFTITNPGTDAVSDLRFSDDLDAVLSGLEATGLPMSDVCGNGSSLTGTSFLELTVASLEANGGSCTFAVDLQVPATTSAGTYTNTSSPLTRNGLELAEPAIADLTIEPAPTFTKVFAPDLSVPGDPSTLTFTIDNSASALAATSLDFIDNLPINVIIATPANASVTCTGGTLTAASGAGVISYTGGTVGAGASCTLQVDVTTDSTGAHVNTSGDLTSSSGNSGTASDTWDVACLRPILGSIGNIVGLGTTCPGVMDLDYEIASVDNATSYTWSFSDPSVIINNNGTNRVTLDNVTTAGTLSLIVSNNCDTSGPITFDIEIASPEVCILAECSRNSIFIDDELLAIVNQTDIFRAIDRVESSATILDTWTKTFKAGDNIELFSGFTVEEGAIFIAEIESCMAQFKEAIGK